MLEAPVFRAFRGLRATCRYGGRGCSSSPPDTDGPAIYGTIAKCNSDVLTALIPRGYFADRQRPAEGGDHTVREFTSCLRTGQHVNPASRR